MDKTNSQLLIRRVILFHFQKSREINPRYSLRAYSQKLSIAAGTLSQIMSGKRRISMKFSKVVCERLNLSHEEKERITTVFRSSIKQEEVKCRELTLEEFGSINHWTHYAILSLIQTKNFRPCASWIAERLGIKKVEAQNALRNLLNLGIIENKQGTIVRTDKRIRTEDDRASLKVREAHKQSMDLAKDALDAVPLHLRDFTTTTLPMDPNIMPFVKEKIRSFYDELECFIEEHPNKTEVYRMNIEIFPLSKIHKGNKA